MLDVSVVIPVYNRSRKILEAVASVLAQDGASFELIVVDDGSEEDQRELRALLEKEGQTYFVQENLGVSQARNVGAAMAQGKYLAFLDSDDRWLPDKLRSQLEFLESNQDFRVCQCREVWFRKGVRVNQKLIHEMPSGEAFERSLERCLISPSSVMMERSLFEELGGFDVQFKVCEDYELWLRMTAGYPVGLVDEALVEKFGGHDDQLSRALPAMDRFRVFAILKFLLAQQYSTQQFEQAREVLATKADIVGLGAWKRGLSTANFYAELCKSAKRADQASCVQLLGPFHSQLEEMLLQSAELLRGA